MEKLKASLLRVTSWFTTRLDLVPPLVVYDSDFRRGFAQ